MEYFLAVPTVILPEYLPLFSRGTYRVDLIPLFRVRMCAKAKIHPRRGAGDNFQDTPPDSGTISCLAG